MSEEPHDDTAIRNLLAMVSFLGDTGELEEYGELFTDDASLTSPAGTDSGRSAILATAAERRLAGMLGPGSGARHVAVPGVVLADRDVATARSCFTFFMTESGRPVLALVGEYTDEIRRVNGRWLLASRTVTFG